MKNSKQMQAAVEQMQTMGKGVPVSGLPGVTIDPGRVIFHLKNINARMAEENAILNVLLEQKEEEIQRLKGEK